MVYGWCLKDYVQDAAIRPDGFEVIIVDGVQRSGKSNQSLQIANWAKHAALAFKLNECTLEQYNKAKAEGVFPMDFFKKLPKQPSDDQIWESVLECVIFKASEFVSYLEAVPDGEPTDVVVWDDVAGHYSNMSFRIDPEAYAQVDGAFTVLGTKAKIIVTNIPNITRLSKNIKDHVTVELFIGRNKLRKIMRLFRLPGLKHVNMNEFKADIEAGSKFDIYKIPSYWWNQYESRRIQLAKDVFQALGETVNMDKAPEGYISVPDAIVIARDNGLKWGASTIQQNASRGLWKKITAEGYMFIEQESFMRIVEAELYQPI
jgi:hypothetical protein